MATPSKTQGTSLLSLQSVSADSTVVSSALDVSAKFAATVFVHFGRTVATALSRGVEIRVEASSKSSGDGHWYPAAILRTASAAVEAEAVSGTVSAGTNVVTVASTTNLVTRDKVFIQNTTIANSEWGRIKTVTTNTSITLEDNLVNAQTGATVYNGAELFLVQLDLSGMGRLRLVVDNTGTGQAVAVEAHVVTLDSIG